MFFPEVTDIALNSPTNLQGFGSNYQNITFAVMNTSNNIEQSYKCETTGAGKAIERRWDYDEPVGAITWSPMDTICVCFNGLAGGRLDSIKVAPRRIGILTGAIYNIAGENSEGVLGSRLSEYFTLTNNTHIPKPYPVPWATWLKMDLSSQNIKTDKAFAVAFGVPKDTSVFANIMVSLFNHTGSYYNYAYSYENSKWLYYNYTDGVIFLYHIRAYIGFENTTKVVELTPKVFHMGQNYPNPFNPATKIQFDLPASGYTKLKIYNLLGKEIQTLVSEHLNSGTHIITWNAANYPSGTYLYKLEYNGRTETKKLLLLK